MESTGIGLPETIIIACVIVAVILIVLRYIPPPSLEKDLEARIASLLAELANVTKRVTEQEGVIKELNDQYRDALEEANEAHRTIRTQAKVVEELKGVNASLTKALGVVNAGLMILGIWPFPEIELNTWVEEEAIYNTGFAYRTLRGKEATKEGIALELQRHVYTVLEVGSHGRAEGIDLYDDLARPGWWVRLFRQHPTLNTVLLLACESDEVADALATAGVPVVVSVQRQIQNGHVALFIKNFYRQLAKSSTDLDDVEGAVEFAKNLLPEKAATMIRVRRGTTKL